jgi:hypothetical protein
MRRIVTAISGAALALSMVASAIPANAAVAGYDSTYLAQSDWLVRSQGQTGSWTVIFQNTGTTTWTRGTSTEVEFAACLEDKVTCNAQDATEAPFNNGWVSATRYADMNQTAVAPGQAASFTVNISVPATQAAGVYHFNGAVVKADTGEDIRNEGAFFDVNVPSSAAATGIALTPASDTNQTGSTHTVTVTYKDASGAAIANAPIDVFVVNDTSPFTSTGGCSLDSSATPSSTGTACTIDAGDQLTDANGQVIFDFSGSVAETHRIIAWTGDIGATFDNDTVTNQGSATKTWIGAVVALDCDNENDLNPFATSHTWTCTLEDADGDAVPLAGEVIRFTVYRNSTDISDSAAASGTNGCGGAVVSINSATTDAGGKVTFTYTGPADPSTSTGSNLYDCMFAHFDDDNDNILDSGEETDTVEKNWTDAAAAASTLELAPGLDGNPTSTTHAVTATLEDQFGNPISGGVVRFQVTRTGATTGGAAQGVVLTGTRTTNSSGVATFAYVGPEDSVIDSIDACYDEDDDGDCDDGAPEITFAAVTNVEKNFADESADTAATAFTIRYCDLANDDLYGQSGAAVWRFEYDSNDQFQIAGVPTTMANFEITYDDDPTGVSLFNITTNN